MDELDKIMEKIDTQFKEIISSIEEINAKMRQTMLQTFDAVKNCMEAKE